ncbi:MAG TPA: lipid-binding SYLF domain-containing protein [Bryobacteraceae bacterium]|nr:lipid-binding SYLF domain-containing protein [Bryobacteraceae bacterium]
MRTLIAVVAIAAAVLPMAHAKSGDAADRLEAASDVLTDMMQASDKGIPQDLMNKAQCVIIVPNLKKAGFVIGAKYGRGFAVCRKGEAGWSAPAGIRIEGGSFGLQIGASEQDVLLLVMNSSGMKRLLADKFTLGGEASAAAGPVGREATAQTDVAMNAEMLSYSRSRGLFAGISLQGATLRPDDDANREMYGKELRNREILTGTVAAPAPAAKLESLLMRNSSRRTR